MAKLQAIRGMNDILPEQTPAWQYLETVFQDLVSRYGYREIRFPIVEQTQLFKRSIGEVTDIVEKEMYSFDDRNGDNLTLRPEGTAGCVRAADQHGLLYNQQQRLWYQGPMFRHERPQKGRYRQFHQFGVEAFGMQGPDIDAEIIQLTAQLWQELDIKGHVALEINNIGSAADRKRFGEALSSYLEKHAKQLDEDARRRMHSNPMRVLDSKNPQVQEVLTDAPCLTEFVGAESVQHYQQLQRLLTDLSIPFTENTKLVRGLDYYNNCVFEWVTESLGAQGAVCGGGRYDALVEQLGGKPTLAAGFAIGIERLVLLLETLDKLPASLYQLIDIYIAQAEPGMDTAALQLAAALRKDFPELRILCHCGGGKKQSQSKRAFNLGATLLLTLARNDQGLLESAIRPVKDDGDKTTLPLDDLQTAVDNVTRQINTDLHGS